MRLLDKAQNSEKVNRYTSSISFIAAGASTSYIIAGIQADSFGAIIGGAALFGIFFVLAHGADERARKIRQVDDYLEGYKRGLSAR